MNALARIPNNSKRKGIGQIIRYISRVICYEADSWLTAKNKFNCKETYLVYLSSPSVGSDLTDTTLIERTINQIKPADKSNYKDSFLITPIISWNNQL